MLNSKLCIIVETYYVNRGGYDRVRETTQEECYVNRYCNQAMQSCPLRKKLPSIGHQHSSALPQDTTPCRYNQCWSPGSMVNP